MPRAFCILGAQHFVQLTDHVVAGFLHQLDVRLTKRGDALGNVTNGRRIRPKDLLKVVRGAPVHRARDLV